MRATIFSPNTAKVTISAPVHANMKQLASGVLMKLLIVVGRLAIGFNRLALQKLLEKAVKRSGAVSPAMRATPRRIPVKMPVRAAR